MRRNNHNRLRTLVFFSILAWAANSTAQTPDTAIIQGKVTDQTGSGIPDANLIITNARIGLLRTAQAKANGGFSFSGLPIQGVYQVTARKPHFAEAQSGDIVLAAGTTANIYLQLNVEGMRSETTVTGVVGAVRADQPQIGISLSAAQMTETPLLDRKITYLPLLNAANRPAINQGDVFMNEDLFTTNGAGRRQTWFEVDGGTGNDSWGRQTIFTNIPLAAVQEMDVLSNAFSAEYGASTGSVVNIITKSGGNAFHGEALDLGRPSAPEAKLSGFNSGNATSGNDLTNDTLEQMALSLSGPLGSAGRTQFFASGEYSLENRASPVISPIAPGNFIGHYRDWLGFFRLDHQFSRSKRFILPQRCGWVLRYESERRRWRKHAAHIRPGFQKANLFRRTWRDDSVERIACK